MLYSYRVIRMIYRLDPMIEIRFSTKKYGRYGIPYLPVRKMKKMYPDGGFVVIGEIGNLARTPSGRDILLTGDGTEVSIFPRGCMRRPFEWIVGYTAVEENTYAAVVQNLFSAFLRYRRRNRMER